MFEANFLWAARPYQKHPQTSTVLHTVALLCPFAMINPKDVFCLMSWWVLSQGFRSFDPWRLEVLVTSGGQAGARPHQKHTQPNKSSPTPPDSDTPSPALQAESILESSV